MYHEGELSSSFLTQTRNFLIASAPGLAFRLKPSITYYSLESSIFWENDPRKPGIAEGLFCALKPSRAGIFPSHLRLMWDGCIFVPFWSISLPLIVIRRGNSKSLRFCFDWMFAGKSGQMGSLHGFLSWVKGLGAGWLVYRPPQPPFQRLQGLDWRLADWMMGLYKALRWLKSRQNSWRWPSTLQCLQFHGQRYSGCPEL